jgi:hypothetical protein
MVGPGALTQRSESGGGRSGGWGVIDKWPVSFFVGGSDLYGLNGLFERAEKDWNLPLEGAVTWRNRISGWTLLSGVTSRTSKRAASSTPTDTSHTLSGRPEWHFLDAQGLDRFRCDGGEYLPNSGRAWSHRHDLTKQTLRVGDRAAARDAVDGYWEKGEEGLVASVEAVPGHTDERPVLWKRGRDGKLFNVQVWARLVYLLFQVVRPHYVRWWRQ